MINSTSFHYKAVKWQSKLFGAGLPVSKCSYAWRIFFTLVLLPFIVGSTIYGFIFVLPVFITDTHVIINKYNFFVGLWFLILPCVALVIGFGQVVITIATWCERCEPVEYDE